MKKRSKKYVEALSKLEKGKVYTKEEAAKSEEAAKAAAAGKAGSKQADKALPKTSAVK